MSSNTLYHKMDLATIHLRYNHKETVEAASHKMTFYDALYVEAQTEQLDIGRRIKVILHPKEDVVINELYIQLPYTFLASDQIFCNGFQSQTESLLYSPQQSLPPVKRWAGQHWQQIGMYQHPHTQDGSANLHSWTYSYIQKANGRYFLMGSLSEQTGFTIIRYYCKQHVIKVVWEAVDFKLTHSFPALDIVLLEGREHQVFDRYAALMELGETKEIPPLRSCMAVAIGFRMEDLQQTQALLAEQDVPIDMVLLQEGYPLAMGDWLREADQVPKGIPAVAQQAHAAGLKAGIRLAPFLCSSSSDFFKYKKQCLLKNRSGQLVTIKDAAAPGQYFYILDFYNKTVTDYLLSFFQALSQQWSYNFMVLDYLYAACLHPPAHKTMGQKMCDALDFLRKACHPSFLIADKVPLGAAFGRVDYAALTSYPIYQWENKWLAWNQVRERSTALSTIPTQLNRRHLPLRMFQQAPSLLMVPSHRSLYRLAQQQSLLLANSLCGTGFIFSNNSMTPLEEEMVSEFKQAIRDQQAEITQVVRLSLALLQIHFQLDGKRWLAWINLQRSKITVSHGSGQMTLQAWEGLVFQSTL
jgi:alpha-galactosidase